jgi:hypothetical protein
MEANEVGFITGPVLVRMSVDHDGFLGLVGVETSALKKKKLYKFSNQLLCNKYWDLCEETLFYN